MLIKKLILKDFAIFKDVEIDFSDIGMSTIIGQWHTNSRRSNGSGKSALLEAIPFALFGTCRTKIKSDVIREGCDRANVYLEFESKGRLIRIYRARTHMSSSCKIWIDGKAAGTQLKVVNDIVKQYVGVDSDLFETIYFFRQDNQYGFAEASPSDRKSFLSKVFDLSKIEACYDKAKVQSATALHELALAEGSLISLQSSLNEFPPRQSLFDSVLDENDKLSRHYLEIESYKAYYDDVDNIANHAQSMIDAYDSETRAALDEISSLRSEHQDNIGKIQSLKRNISMNTVSADKHKAELELITDTDVDMSESVDDIQKQIEDIDNNVNELVNQSAKFDHSITLDNEMINSSKSIAGTKCTTCYQVVAVDHVKSLVERCRARVKKNVKLNGDIRVDIVDMRFAIGNLRKTKSNRQQADMNIARIETLNDAIKTFKSSVTQAKKTLVEIEQRQNTINQNLSILTSNINIGESVKSMNGLQHIIDSFRSSNRDCISQFDIDAAIRSASQAESRLELYDNILIDIDEANQNINQANENVFVHKTVCDIFSKNGLQAILIENVMGVIEEFANDILKQMQTRFTVEMRTQKETKAGDARETLEIFVYDNGRPRAFKSYSGGERTMINLAIRLSLSKIISSLHGVVMQSIFLDEVLAALDEVNREEAIRVLSYLSKSFDQIFIISHTAEIKSLINSKITVLRHEDYSDVVVDLKSA